MWWTIRIKITFFTLMLILYLAFCGYATAGGSEKQSTNDTEMVKMALHMKINGVPVEVEWEDNESVQALSELACDGLTIQMSMYGGFEQVGPIGHILPRNDTQITTTPGDIVLYSGNQIVIFYGSNSWSYTRLGHITDKTDTEMAALLSNGDVDITISSNQ